MSDEPAVPIVADSNVLVPALYIGKPIARFLRDGQLRWVWNDFIYWEASKVICRMADYYIRRVGVTAEYVLIVLEHIASNGIIVPEMPPTLPNVVVRDRSDDNFLWAPVTGKAEFIVSEDKPHLLGLRRFRDIPIGNPREFFDWVQIAHPWTQEEEVST